MDALKEKAVKGAAWMVSMRLAVNLLGLVSTVFLARLLTPTDFGIVALAGSAYAFFSMMGQFGFDSALIHMKEPSDEHYHSAWTANIIVGATVSVIMFGVAAPAARFFSEPRIENVVYAFSLLSLAKGFENIGVVNFRKSLKFMGDFLYFVIPKIVSVIVAVTAAYILKSYWALVIGMVTSQVITLLYSHFAQPFRPRFAVSKIPELLGFSRWILSNNGLQYLSSNGVEVILGRLKDSSAVGLFGIAKQLAYLPSSELLAPINRALFPSFSSVADDPERLHSILSRVISVAAIISVPAAFGILALADTLILVVFGDKWVAAAPLLSVLGFAGVVAAAKSAFGPVLLARGEPKIVSHSTLAQVIISLPLVFILVASLGTVGVAYASLAGAIVTLPVLVYGVRNSIGFGWLDLTKSIWRPLTAAIAMFFVVRAAQSHLSLTQSGVVVLLELVVIGVVVFSVALAGVWLLSGRPKGAEQEIIDQLRQRLGQGRVS